MTAEPIIVVQALRRTFRVTERDSGFRAAMRSIVHRDYREIVAVDNASFEVREGEIVGFLGPNGAGKTTVLKCVSGLLTPTAGSVLVHGRVPSKREVVHLRNLGFVMGQRWQLHPDLPVADSFEIQRVTYDIDGSTFAESRAELVELLDLAPLLRQPVRGLSLGQRMRCELASALLHRPSVLLLDEPTLGLDFDAQAQVRRFVQEYALRHQAAVLLTSHYLADIEALSDRVLTISSGRITFEGTFDTLRAIAGERKRLTARLRGPVAAGRLALLGTVVEITPGRAVLDVARADSGSVLTRLQELSEVLDVSLTDPPVEETLASLYGHAPAT